MIKINTKHARLIFHLFKLKSEDSMLYSDNPEKKDTSAKDKSSVPKSKEILTILPTPKDKYNTKKLDHNPMSKPMAPTM